MAKWRQNNGDRNDPWGFFPQDRSREQKCYDCGKKTTGRHHVVPKALGGSKIIPLCHKCHTKVHGYVVHKDAIIAGLRRAKKRGIRLGAPSKLTDKTRKQIKLLRRKGKTIKQIALRMNLSVGTICKVLK